MIQVTTRVSDGLMDVDYQWNRNGACGYTQWRILAPISSRIRRIQPPWKHAYGPNHAQVDALLVGGGGTGTWVPWFMPANWPHEAPMGLTPLLREHEGVGSASSQALQARPHGHEGAWGHVTAL